jgi:uncharacterized alpha-E superfamily protein
MLSRTADSLYWLGRYLERAENLARILEVADRMALTPGAAGRHNEWQSAIVISGAAARFDAGRTEATAAAVIGFLVGHPDNPSSIRACLLRARTNARSVRAALTRPMWESLNDAWLDLDARERLIAAGDLRGFLDWVRERSMLFHGAMATTMVRDSAFDFLRLGTLIERADNTARLLDVKYHILLPRTEAVGGVVDYYQWAALLRGVSALGSYAYLYHDTIKPWLVAELLILRPEMPRSLSSCLAEITMLLDQLAEAHGERHEGHRLAEALHAQLRQERIEQVFRAGLHEYLTDFIDRCADLGREIGRAYLLG